MVSSKSFSTFLAPIKHCVALRAFGAPPLEAVSLSSIEAVTCSFPFCGQIALTCTGKSGRDKSWLEKCFAIVFQNCFGIA